MFGRLRAELEKYGHRWQEGLNDNLPMRLMALAKAGRANWFGLMSLAWLARPVISRARAEQPHPHGPQPLLNENPLPWWLRNGWLALEPIHRCDACGRE